MFAFYRCRTKECNVRISVHTSKDLITDVRGVHLHGYELLGSLVKAKVDEVKKQALDGAYSKPCALQSTPVWWPALKVIQQQRWGLVSFIIIFLLDLFLTFFIFVGLAISHRSLARIFQKKHKLSFGDTKLPSAWSDLVDIPSQFKKTSSGEEFLIMNKKLDNTSESRILGFSSPSLMDVFRKSREISIDGTFDITKWTLFSQVKIIIYVNLRIFEHLFVLFLGLAFLS